MGTIPFLIMGITALVLTSCGTYNSGYSDTDGIYSSGEEVAVEEKAPDRGNYYRQYFNSKANELGNIPEDEDLVFTDIEAYTTSEYMDDEGNIVIEERDDYEEGYGPWGSNAEDVTVNMYNNSGFNFGYWNSPYWGYNSYWGYPYSFYRPYWNWGIGFGGWGYPYYGGFYGWGYPFYGGGYYPYYYNNYYAHGGYYGNNYHNGISYNRGRRNTDYTRSNARGRSSDATNSRRSYSRSELIRRTNARRRNSNFSRRNTNSVRRNSNIGRSSNSRSNNVRSN